MKVLGVIPSRYASERFPGKPLTLIAGTSMIRRVFEQAAQSPALDLLVVATDDERILKHVEAYGGQAVMTSPLHRSGTERCCEVLNQLDTVHGPFDIVVNIQGDEPFINPELIALVVSCFDNPDACIATLASPLLIDAEADNPNVVKLVQDVHGKALYFSRLPLPYNRQGRLLPQRLKHTGIYAYRSAVLRAITQLPPSDLELSEMLEQLRWLENGFSIYVKVAADSGVAIDTPEDLLKAEEFLKNQTHI